MRHRTLLVAAVAMSLPIFAGRGRAQGDGEQEENRGSSRRFFRVSLVGDNENAPISTLASGSARFIIHGDTTPPTLEYHLTYRDLQADATQSHVHFGQSNVNGGVMFFLCNNTTATPPGPPPPCPLRAGTVDGVITADNVIGPAGQGIAVGEFSEALRAIGNGLAYANVHSTMFPAGEIRGQLR
jgi:hypothetical protein